MGDSDDRAESGRRDFRGEFFIGLEAVGLLAALALVVIELSKLFLR